MTLGELQKAGKRWASRPALPADEDHNRWWLKDRIRSMVEVANATRLDLEELAQEVRRELEASDDKAQGD